MMSIEVLKSEALKLNKLERIEFARYLIDTLAIEESLRQNESLSAEQIGILLSRKAEMESGVVKGIPAEEVEQNLILKYGLAN